MAELSHKSFHDPKNSMSDQLFGRSKRGYEAVMKQDRVSESHTNRTQNLSSVSFLSFVSFARNL